MQFTISTPKGYVHSYDADRNMVLFTTVKAKAQKFPTRQAARDFLTRYSHRSYQTDAAGQFKVPECEVLPKATTPERTFPCQTSFEGYDWRNELTVTSPKTGRTVRVQCNGNWHRMSKGLSGKVGRLHTEDSKVYRWGDWVAVDFTAAELLELLAFADEHEPSLDVRRNWDNARAWRAGCAC